MNGARGLSGAHQEGDADLIEAAAAGSQRAYTELWHRYAPAGLRFAAYVTSDFDADDVVAEAFARIFHAISIGGGPRAAFRPYLITTIRNTVVSWSRKRRDEQLVDADLMADSTWTDGGESDRVDQQLVVTALKTLPSRWRQALWYREVEGLTPREAAAIFDMSPNAVSALNLRSREGLRQAFIQAHVNASGAGGECGWVLSNVGGYSRNKLSIRDSERVDAHLGECQRCTSAVREAHHIARNLAEPPQP